MTSFSQLPPPGNGQSGNAGRAWPQQPPPVSSGAPGSQYGGGGPQYGGPDYRGGSAGSGYAGPGYGGAAGYGGAPPGARPLRGRRRFWGQPGRHGRRIVLVIVVVLVLILAGVGGTYFWLNGKLHRTVSLPAFTGTSAGTNWLIAGSDTRDGITRAERATLHLGAQGANASDSLMLLHMGTGKPVLISIPRDSYVNIPGYGQNKINAALAFGGPTLLIKTVEQATGLRIDHYMGIGFGGLASVVNSVGGVRICVKTAIPADSNSGFKGLAAGCHTSTARRRSPSSATGTRSPPRTCSGSRTSGRSCRPCCPRRRARACT